MKMQSLEYTSPVNNLANGLYAIAEVNTKPYSVLLNDIIITKRLPGTRVGDILQLTRVRELGSKVKPTPHENGTRLIWTC